MPFVTVPADTWTPVVTTTVDSVVINRGSNNMYVTTESTGSLARDEAMSLAPGEGFIFGSGVTVSAYSVGRASKAFYMAITA